MTELRNYPPLKQQKGKPKQAKKLPPPPKKVQSLKKRLEAAFGSKRDKRKVKYY